MKRRRVTAPVFNGIFTSIYFISDVATSLFSIAAAYYFRFNILAPDLHRPTKENYLALAVIFTALNVYFFFVAGLYRSRRGQGRIDIFFLVFKSVFFSSLALMVLLFLYRDFSYARLIMIYGMTFAAILVGVARVTINSIERILLRAGQGTKKLLIIGTGGDFKNIATRFIQRPDMGYSIEGYLEENPGGKLGPIPLLGNIAEAEERIVLNDVDVVIVTLEREYHSMIKDVVDLCDRRGVECMIAPDMMELLAIPRFYEELCGVPLIRVKGLRIRGIYA
ncbi:MAG: hypothetical protein KAG97_08485, partial [Victivallales bacterium]|nr:hypothetical protein [Victivallales bacterium]